MGLSALNIFLKRALDIALSAAGIFFLMPVLAGIAILVRFDSKGPALFRQGRLGKNGEVFLMLKFRTMVENAENMGTGLFNFKDDLRVTRVGGFLRRTSLDELPQLFNVLLGEMSLVGPRPPVHYELGKYTDLTDVQRRRFTVPQGITGLAQVSGRNELPWEEKIQFDNKYVELFKQYGILLDFKILLLTVVKIFESKNVYEVKDESLQGISDEEIALKARRGLLVKNESESGDKGDNV